MHPGCLLAASVQRAASRQNASARAVGARLSILLTPLPCFLSPLRPLLCIPQHTMPFSQINAAFELLHSGKCLRTVLTFN